MQLFISYKRENEEFARLVRDNLLAWGYAVWMDIFDIPKGSYWPDEIDKGLRASDVIIGILSPQAVESRNVKNEWDWAIVNGRRLILLMHEQTYVPMNYVSLQRINCVGVAQSNGISELQAALQSKPSAPTTSPDPLRDYLQKLYDRINRYLGQKILATLRTDEGMPEPLRLIGESTPEAVEGLFSRQPQIDPLFAIGGIEDDLTPLEKFTDFQQAFDYFKGRVLLLGEPGAGKTITLLHTARDAVVRRLQDPTQPVPILGIIPTWIKTQKPFRAWLMGNVSDVAVDHIEFETLVAQGKTLLLLDGLDELGGERPVDREKPDGEKFDPRQRFLEMLPPNNHVLVTCRRQDYAEIGSKAKLNGAITLHPLSEAQIAAYLRGTPALWQAVQNDPGLRKIVETPLLLKIFAVAYRNHPEDAEKLKDLGNSPADLRDVIFTQYVEERYRHEEAKYKAIGQEMPFSREEIYNLVGKIALILTMMQHMPLKDTYLENELTRDRSKAFFGIATKLHYFVKTQEAEANYDFIHDLVRDYFARKHIENVLSDPNSDERRFALIVLGSDIKDASFTPQVIDIMLNDPSSELRMYAASALGPDERAFEPLIGALSDPEWGVRTSAVLSLGQFKQRRAVDVLIQCLKEDVNDLVVIDALARIGDKRALPHILEHYQLRKAIGEMGHLTEMSFLEQLGKLATDEDEIVELAIQKLIYYEQLPFGIDTIPQKWIPIGVAQKMKSPQFVPYLIPLLADPYSRTKAIEALRAIGTPEALMAIEEAERREDSQ